jgi:hypothetical protein
MFLEIRTLLVRDADLTTTCEPIVWTMWDSQHLITV